jgi:TIR domain
MTLYHLALMGAPSASQIADLERCLSIVIEPFGLHLGSEVELSICPPSFEPPETTAAAVAFFARVGASETGLNSVLRKGIPVLPVAATNGRVDDIPLQLKPLNCLTYETHGPQRISTALLECVGLLPRQRRVFVSYRRDEARAAALQLFDALSARLFDVFLDTHGIAPAEDFQAVLWHRLCDSDVLVMLDTPGYFDSRWTNAEFGRALAKGISVLRIGWPGFTPSRRISTASRVDLATHEIDVATGLLADRAIERICTQIETVRSQSQAIRSLNLFSNLRQAVECIGGTVAGVGLHKAIYVDLPTGAHIVIYPTVGVPTSVTLNDAINHAPDRSVAVLYDHIGLHENWLKHLTWLGDNIRAARWVRASEAAWAFGGWEV